MKEQALHSMIRVNHAGEYGAIRIYEGQRAILGETSLDPVLETMEIQERAHFKIFDDLMRQRQVRPTIFQPIWHVAGFALGAGSALLGRKAAMACTVAVESVIDAHYQSQLTALQEDEESKDIREKIAFCHQEELEHKDQALAHEAETMVGYKVFSTFVRGASKLAISLSKRF